MLEDFVKIKKKERLLAEAKVLKKKMKVETSASELIRDERNERARPE